MDDKTVVITGGNRGIGLDITKTYLQDGWKVFVGARHNDITQKLNDDIQFVTTDVQKESDLENLVNTAIDSTGKLDVFINNAGFSEWRPISDIDELFLDKIIATNLKGVIWGCKSAAKVMKEGSTIINISSIAGKRGSVNNTAYCATKFAVNGITQSLAKELGPRGIRVNALCPVLVKTNGLIEALKSPISPAKGEPDKFIDQFMRTNSALGKLPSGLDVAAMCLLLSSNMSSAVTGQCINVDCGVFPQ